MQPRVCPVVCGVALVAVLVAAPAGAQQRQSQPPNLAVGEKWSIEFGIGTWSPAPISTVSAGSGGAAGSEISGESDLGFEDRLLKRFSFAFRPGWKHKIRVAYEPASYDASATLARALLFGGQTFPAGDTVASSLHWKGWRFGYEYDFIYRPRFFAGLILESRYDDIEVSMAGTSAAAVSSLHTAFPMAGGIVRVYPLSNVSLTAEFTGMRLWGELGGLTNCSGHAFDLDLYATLNFRDSFGIRSGYRSMEVNYEWDVNRDELARRGFYVMGLMRF
jgi:hypothetical protein